MNITTRTLRLTALLAVASTLVLATGKGVARASSTSLLGGCPAEQLSQPFLPWGDPSSYKLVADGGFEGGAAGWSLRGAASVVDGNEPWHTRAPGDSRSLNLPSGAQAVSPATCVGLLDPTLRFFARSLGGTVHIDVTLHVGLLTTTMPVGAVNPGDSFAPTLPLAILGNLLTPLGSGVGSVNLTFTAVGGAAQIDDVYVDPFKVN